MNFRRIAGLTFVASSVLVNAAGVNLTSVFSFDTDSAGTAVYGVVWDTNPGYYWNLYLADGTPAGNPDGLTGPILNPGGA